MLYRRKIISPQNCRLDNLRAWIQPPLAQVVCVGMPSPANASAFSNCNILRKWLLFSLWGVAESNNTLGMALHNTSAIWKRPTCVLLPPTLWHSSITCKSNSASNTLCILYRLYSSTFCLLQPYRISMGFKASIETMIWLCWVKRLISLSTSSLANVRLTVLM